MSFTCLLKEPQAVKAYEILIRNGMKWSCLHSQMFAQGMRDNRSPVMDAVRCLFVTLHSTTSSSSSKNKLQDARRWQMRYPSAPAASACENTKRHLLPVSQWRWLLSNITHEWFLNRPTVTHEAFVAVFLISVRFNGLVKTFFFSVSVASSSPKYPAYLRNLWVFDFTRQKHLFLFSIMYFYSLNKRLMSYR